MFASLLVLVLVLAARGADADGGGAACATSSIGYACSVALESGMNLHWTLGPADATSQVASVADGDIAIALAGTSDGMVGVSFPSAHAMSPANAVLGWINADGSGGSIGPYAMTSRSTPSSGGLALSSSSVTKSGGVTIIAFATTRSAVMTDDAHRLGYVGWARATSKANVKHDVSKGTVYLNYLTGNADSHTDVALETHGALMTAAFAFFFLGSAIALTKKASWMPWAGGETKTWLYAHVTAHAVGVGLACAGLVEIFTGRTHDPFAWEGADGVVKAHGVLGMIVTCAPALQAAFAYAMRNDKKKKKKKHARDDDDGDDGGGGGGGERLAREAPPPPPPPKTSAPRRAHVVGGWVVVLGGSINVVVGASLLNDQTGEDASAFSAVGWALAIASIAAVAAARGRGFCCEEKTVRDY